MSEPEERRRKLEEIKKLGIDPYGHRWQDKEDVVSLLENFDEARVVRSAGRITALRSHGKTLFADMCDARAKIQLYFKKAELGEKAPLVDLLDMGDFLGVQGRLFKTRMGEKSIHVDSFSILSKSLHPLPEKWHGLKDPETRLRQRYLDLASSEESRRVFEIRSEILRQTRGYLNSLGFQEVETPIVQPLAGGAAGEPLVTHLDVYDLDLYLRIAPELYLKRLLVGGMEKIYEIGKSFRNEGISTRHNPEFTMLEAYQAYADYTDMMGLVKGLIQHCAKEVRGALEIEYGGRTLDFSSFETVSFAELMQEHFDITPSDPLDTWVKRLRKKGVEVPGETPSRTALINLVAELIEPKARSSPTFVVDFFTELSPLARSKKENPHVAERFELYIGGLEVANAYTEQNDPEIQRERFLEQKRLAGARQIDEDYILALEYGMPPAGGLGVGMDRLAMLLSNSSTIRDVILFPQLRPATTGAKP
ncbi:MAG: lysine--tRNA ligase [Candidatus Omnitrophica bacterium]|nr:lysine--tRNA ligase [Candidatus Omnitrophota bacterium]